MYFPPHAGTDAILRGLVSQNSQSMDSFITREVTQHLFADHPPRGLGEDLASLNMQRAREHGIPGGHSKATFSPEPLVLLTINLEVQEL